MAVHAVDCEGEVVAKSQSWEVTTDQCSANLRLVTNWLSTLSWVLVGLSICNYRVSEWQN